MNEPGRSTTAENRAAAILWKWKFAVEELVGRWWNEIRRTQIANSVAAQSACNNEVEGPRSDVSKARPALINQRISPHFTSPVHTGIHSKI